MRKHAETFVANKGYKLAVVAFNTNFVIFKIQICGTLFKHHWPENEALRTPTFHMKMDHFNIVFQGGPFFLLGGPFFLRSRVRVCAQVLEDTFYEIIFLISEVPLK